MESRRKSRKHSSVTLARALSKLGICTRSQAWGRIIAGDVSVNGDAIRDPNAWIDLSRDRILVYRQLAVARPKTYLMLNKPRGLVTTRSDEKNRPTVYECLSGSEFESLMPVGRLDAASEGLLLFTNDTQWANHLTDPSSHVDKIYHVQVEPVPCPSTLVNIQHGVQIENEVWKIKSASVIRSGGRTAWIEITIDEGKNRQIRRVLQTVGLSVLRLIRISIGTLELGDLQKGKWRLLSSTEIGSLEN